MSVEFINQKITSFGFTEEEAQYYVFISLMGPTPIRTLVRRFDTHRVRVYRTLKKLEDGGFIERILGRPVKYVAVPIDKSLQNSIDDVKKKLSDLETTRGEILSEWEKISKGVEPQTEEPRFRIHQGRQQIYDQLIQMCERAENEISLVTTENDLHRLALFGFDDILKPLVSRGVQVNIMTEVKSIEFEEINEYYQFTSTRHVPLPSPVRFIVIDDAEALLTVSMDDEMRMSTQNDTGLWTNSGSLISVLSIFYNALWRLASEVPDVVKAMKTGKTLQEIRTLRTQKEFQDSFIEMVNRSNSTLDIYLKNLNDAPEIYPTISAALQRKVVCRILTQVSLENVDKLKDWSDLAAIRHYDSESTMNLVVVDDMETLLNLPSWESRNQSIWSDLSAYVDTMKHSFAEHWDRGEPVNDVISRIRSEQSHLEFLQTVSGSFTDHGWMVDSPGTIKGNSGNNHTFNLVTHNPNNPEKKYAIDLLEDDSPLGQIIRMQPKKIDLTNTQIVVISKKPLETEVESLAKLYMIQLIGESDLDAFLGGLFEENQ